MRRGPLLFLLYCTSLAAHAHNSYTGGFSGAPGRQACAASCHGSAGGTLAVSGFPTAYQPGQNYRISIRHNGGSSIVNFNVTTRVGSSSTVAGTFVPLTNCATYAGSDGGVYANPHTVDSAVFQWTAPPTGFGPITLYAAGFQGTTSRSSGQNSALSITSTEIVTAVEDQPVMPTGLHLSQNFPNPFNPTTVIHYQLSLDCNVVLAVYNSRGQQILTLVDEHKNAGSYSVRWNASNVPSGVYFYRLTTGRFSETKKLIVAK
jgi:hypothetical protein